MIFFSLLIFFLILGGGILFYTNLSMGGKNRSFNARGIESGFSIKEIDLLRQLANKTDLEDPCSIFISQPQLDKCIRYLVKNMYLAQNSHDFLSKLYDFRKKIEMDSPRAKQGIFNSRQITDSQNLRILVKGVGVFKSQVVKNTNQYLTISCPLIPNQPPGSFSWMGQQISISFWREDDAEYIFATSVVDEVKTNRGLPALKVVHSELVRTQKRKSIRVKLHKAAFIYSLTDDENPNKVEAAPGLKCFLEDLSDTGCAIIIGGEGGKGITGMRIKVQFVLNNSPVVMCGTIRSLEYKEKTNRSLLHVEADSLPIETRNKILGAVFGMVSDDDEEDLPFRALNEDAEVMTKGKNSSTGGESKDNSGDNGDNIDGIILGIE